LQVSRSFNFEHYKSSGYEDHLLTKITECNQTFEQLLISNDFVECSKIEKKVSIL